MTRFTFRFDILLRLRENEREAAQQKVFEAQRALQILESQREEIEQQRRELRNQSQQRLQGQAFSVDAMLQHGRFDMQLAADAQSLLTNCETIGVEIQRRQAVVRAADVEVKRLERLKETQHKKWTLEQQAIAQKELDELASRRFTRNRHSVEHQQWQ